MIGSEVASGKADPTGCELPSDAAAAATSHTAASAGDNSNPLYSKTPNLLHGLCCISRLFSYSNFFMLSYLLPFHSGGDLSSTSPLLSRFSSPSLPSTFPNSLFPYSSSLLIPSLLSLTPYSSLTTLLPFPSHPSLPPSLHLTHRALHLRGTLELHIASPTATSTSRAPTSKAEPAYRSVQSHDYSIHYSTKTHISTEYL